MVAFLHEFLERQLRFVAGNGQGFLYIDSMAWNPEALFIDAPASVNRACYRDGHPTVNSLLPLVGRGCRSVVFEVRLVRLLPQQGGGVPVDR